MLIVVLQVIKVVLTEGLVVMVILIVVVVVTEG